MAVCAPAQDRYLTDEPLLIVLGLSPTGLYVIREAAACGIQVQGYSDGEECAASSCHLSNPGRDSVLAMDDLERKLVRLATQRSRLCVIPTTDRHVEFLFKRASVWPSNVYMAGAYRSPTARHGLDKTEITRIAREAGLLVPGEHDLGDLDYVPGNTDFPVILKPKSIHHQRHWLKGKKLFLCQDRTSWDEVHALPEFKAAEWTAQALVHGPESNIQVAAVYRGGQGDATCFTARKLRQYPVNFGSASLLVSECDEEVERQALRLLEAMDFKGIAGVEFKRDVRDGKLYLIEMNPRPSLWFSAATAHGEYLVYRQLAEWFGESVQSPKLPFSARVTWRYALKDRLAARAHRRGRTIDAIPRPDIAEADEGKTTWAVYQAGDPRPAWAELVGYARKALSRWSS